MSRGLNKIQIIGRLGRDPEMRYTPQGTAVTNFTVATGGKWTDRNGNERDDTEWFRVEAWDRLAEISNEYLSKGREVYVEGRLKTRNYTDREGRERTAVEIVANNLLLLGGRGDNPRNSDDDSGYDDAEPAPRSSRSESKSARNVPQPMGDDLQDDDIPF